MGNGRRNAFSVGKTGFPYMPFVTTFAFGFAYMCPANTNINHTGKAVKTTLP